MDILTKKRLLIGSIIILMIINISALTTIAYYHYEAKKHIENVRQNKKRNKRYHGRRNRLEHVKRYVRKKLDLSDEQFKTYSALKDLNVQNTRKIWKRISETRNLTYKEYCKENPDTVFLNQLSDSIGLLHKELHREMIRHYTEVEKILTPGQQKKFRKMLCRMSEEQFPKRKD